MYWALWMDRNYKKEKGLTEIPSRGGGCVFIDHEPTLKEALKQDDCN